MGDMWMCWHCGKAYWGEADLCAYKPIGSDVAYDVCTDCWDDLMEARDYEES